MVVKKENKKDMQQKINDYVAYFEKFKGILKEREYEIDQLKYAILISEHVLFCGTPGTAKSMLATKVFNGFFPDPSKKGEKGPVPKFFNQQFTRFMDENYVFGPQSLEKFKQGVIEHNTENSIVDAHFARLDELPNASEELLVALNEVLNERSFTRQSQKIKSPLITAIITTNVDRSVEKELSAFYDRILFSSDVPPIVDLSNKMRLYQDHLGGKHHEQPRFDFQDLLDIHADFAEYKPEFSDYILQQFDSLVTQTAAKMQKTISDRTRTKYLNLIKASAYLDNKAAKIQPHHILVLVYAIVKGGDGGAKNDFEMLVKSISILKEYEERFLNITERYRKKVLPMDIKDSAKLSADKLKKDSSVVVKFRLFVGAEQTLTTLQKDLEKMKDKCSIDELNNEIENIKNAISVEKGKLGFTFEELVKAAEGLN